MVKRWLLTDAYSADTVKETWTFPRNPREMTTIHADRTINTMTTTQGARLLFEGTPPVKQWTFSGPILEKDLYTNLYHWTYEKKRRFTLTDHYNRILTVVFTSLEATPKRRVNYYWSHEYTVNALILRVQQDNSVPNVGPAGL